MFIYILSSILTFICYITILAEFDIFYTPLIITGLVLVVFIFCLIIIKKRIKIDIKKTDIPAYIIIFIFTLYCSIFFHDNFYGSRDPGLYLDNAVYLARNHTLKMPVKVNPQLVIAQTYDQDKFTQSYFLARMEIPHMGWIGTFVALFGYMNINFVFFIPIFLGLVCLYFIFKETSNIKIAILTLVLYVSCFAVNWWFRSTAVENSAFFLLFSSFYLLLIFLREKNIFSLLFSVLAMGIYALVRSEGFFNLIIYLGLLIYTIGWSKINLNKKRLYIIISSILVVIILNLFYVVYFLAREEVLNATHELQNIIVHISHIFSSKHSSSSTQNTNTGPISGNSIDFVNLILGEYGIYLPIMFYFVLLIAKFKKVLLNKDAVVYKSKYLFYILLIILPNFYLLINPQIALDQPWFLRRFYHLIIPFGYFSFLVVLYKIKNKAIVTLVFLIIFLINVIISVPTLNANNRGVIQQIQTFSNHVPNNGLIISDTRSIDRYPIAEPLYFVFGKEVIRINQENDIQYILPLIKDYSNVYFIIDDYYSADFKNIISDSTLIYSQKFYINKLLQTCEIPSYTNVTRESIYSFCKDTGIPNQFRTTLDSVSIYLVKDKNKIFTIKYNNL